MKLLYMEIAKMKSRLFYMVIIFSVFCLFFGCNNDLKEIPINISQENSDIISLDFSQIAQNIEWDTLRIIKPYSEFGEMAFENWNMRKLKNFTQTDIHILVLYTFRNEITGYSLVPRGFDLFQLWGHSDQSNNTNLVFIKDNSRFEFKKEGDVYKIINQDSLFFN